MDAVLPNVISWPSPEGIGRRFLLAIILRNAACFSLIPGVKFIENGKGKLVECRERTGKGSGRVVLFQLVGELREKRGTRVRDSCVFVCVTRIHALINTTDGALPKGPRPSLEKVW